MNSHRFVRGVHVLLYLGLFFCGELSGISLFPQGLAAENTAEDSSKSSPDFSGDGKPGNGTAGDSRDGCPSVEPKLTVLMPDSNLGRTTLEQPTIWFYVPYTSTQIALAIFSLQDTSGEDVGDPIEFSLPDESPGFVSVTLPEALSLESTDTPYHWYFELYCDVNGSPVYVDGWVEQVGASPDLQSQLADGEIPTDVAYTNNVIWFDAIAALAELRTQNPTDTELAERWQALLTATGVSLGYLPEEQFVGEVTIE